jgi:hypothetical protein
MYHGYPSEHGVFPGLPAEIWVSHSLPSPMPCLGYATQSLHFPWCQRRLNAPTTPLHVRTHNDDWALMNARIQNTDTMVIRVNQIMLFQDFRTGSGLATGVSPIPCLLPYPSFALVMLSSGPSTFLGSSEGLTPRELSCCRPCCPPS